MRLGTAVLCVVIAAGCGEGATPVSTPDEAQPESQQAQAVAQPKDSPKQAPPASLVRPAIERKTMGPELKALGRVDPEAPWDVVVQGTGLSADEGKTAKVAVAVMSCGYWVTGTGTAKVEQGGFSIAVPKAAQGEMNHELFLWLDRDGDGACDAEKGDGVFKATDFQGAPGATAQVDGAKLTPVDGWMCFLFNGYGG